MVAYHGHIMTLANSIIGVGILAMPFCFQKCGIILSVLLLLMNNLVTRISCHYLIKSSIITRRKSFEFIAFHTFGSSGKLMVELCIIGYLLGTCIAYFVVVGDLGPQIIAKILNSNENEKLRVWIMISVTVFCIIPLGLLKNVDSLSVVCTASIGFYFCLVIKIVSESSMHLLKSHLTMNIEYWKPSGVLQCLPIFSMALACQIQLFEVLETLPNPSVEKMNNIVNSATTICTYVYILVGFFGYIAFGDQSLSGNILVHLSTSLASDAIKMGFVLSIAFSFPLVIFPCRASIYSLLYRKGHNDTTGYIPEFRFKFITISIILFSLFVGLLIPSIELVIGLVGSTIGVAICIMFPALCYLKIFKKESTERSLAQFILISGFCLMILGTYANLSAIDEKHSGLTVENDDHQKIIQHNKFKNVSANSDYKQNSISSDYRQNQTKSEENKVIRENFKGNNKPIGDDIQQNKPITPVTEKSVENSNQIVKNLPENPKLTNIFEKINEEESKKILMNQEEKQIKIDDRKPIEIDKEAIKKDEEITAEEEAKQEIIKKVNNNSDIVAAKELVKTKEFLKKTVDEIKEHLAKQNVETQNLVVEKLSNIVQKVQQIEKRVYTDNTDNKQPNLNNEPSQKQDNKIDTNNENLKKLEIQKNADVNVISKEKDIVNNSTSIKENKLIKAKKLDENLPVQINDSSEKGKTLQPNLLKKQENKIQQPPLPLPLLINSTMVKQNLTNTMENVKNHDKREVDETNKFKKLIGKSLLDVNSRDAKIMKTEKSPNDDNVAVEKENIQSIQKNGVEVVTNPNDIIGETTSSSNTNSDKKSNDGNKNNDKFRTKRESSKDMCISWDVKKSDCLDNILSVGRDLKFVKDKT